MRELKRPLQYKTGHQRKIAAYNLIEDLVDFVDDVWQDPGTPHHLVKEANEFRKRFRRFYW